MQQHLRVVGITLIVAGCASPAMPAPSTAAPPSTVAPRASALLRQFEATEWAPPGGGGLGSAAPAPCPIRAEESGGATTLLLRHSLERDSVVEGAGLATHRLFAVGDYEVLTPADRLGLRESEWLRLDCQTLRSVAIVAGGA